MFNLCVFNNKKSSKYYFKLHISTRSVGKKTKRIKTICSHSWKSVTSFVLALQHMCKTVREQVYFHRKGKTEPDSTIPLRERTIWREGLHVNPVMNKCMAGGRWIGTQWFTRAQSPELAAVMYCRPDQTDGESTS